MVRTPALFPVRTSTSESPTSQTLLIRKLQGLHDMYDPCRIGFLFNPFLLAGHIIKPSLTKYLFYHLHGLLVRLIRQHSQQNAFFPSGSAEVPEFPGMVLHDMYNFHQIYAGIRQDFLQPGKIFLSCRKERTLPSGPSPRLLRIFCTALS